MSTFHQEWGWVSRVRTPPQGASGEGKVIFSSGVDTRELPVLLMMTLHYTHIGEGSEMQWPAETAVEVGRDLLGKLRFCRRGGRQKGRVGERAYKHMESVEACYRVMCIDTISCVYIHEGAMVGVRPGKALSQ